MERLKAFVLRDNLLSRNKHSSICQKCLTEGHQERISFQEESDEVFFQKNRERKSIRTEEARKKENNFFGEEKK
ncbi:hypothetical protein QNI19_03520 [Cytophagaceae bacterium DM2B3-1]|uniref:Uncharacterized protein n=2 Tax=Xanthocytophaga flava TaxID=3048013 RepID=A0ABT7CE25_9BACT|nr:hypothetical protein [Xanthocytophaga flavus]